MKKASSPRVLLIQDDTDTAHCIEKRLAGHGFAVEIVQEAAAGTAMGNRAAYAVLCIDITGPPTALLPVMRAFAEEGGLPPTIILTGPQTGTAAREYKDLGPVCFIFRDSEGRFLDTLPCLVERLSALETLTREKQGLEKALGEAHERLFMSQKMEAIGMLAGGIAHDFNNILATILGYASFLRGKATTDDIFFQGLSAIEDSAVRASELTSQLLTYSRGTKAQIGAVPVNQVVREVCNIIRKTFDRSIEIRTDLDEEVGTIDADISRIKLMVLSLFINARDVMPMGGVLTVKTCIWHAPDERIGARRDIPPGRYVGISVSDTRAVTDEKTRPGTSEPPLSRESDNEIAGSSLSVACEVINELGGWINVESRIGVGTEFVILFAAPKKKKKEALQAELGTAGRGSETILIIDDEAHIVQMLHRILTDFGYRVLRSGSGAEGVGVFEEKGNEIELVILDIMMPGMGGKEVMSRLVSLRPDVKILLASGFSDQELHHDLMAMGAAGFIGKPFVIRDLLKKIRNILG
jgi:two-component system cell cycle sensor histidine kinase/response regulator CckA